MENNLIKKLEDLIRKGLELEEAFQFIDWKGFEEAIAQIFESYGYNVRRNVILVKEGKRYQIDLVAENFNTIFVIDCKHWGKHWYKTSGLKKACSKQKERCLVFSREFNNKRVIPLIITLFDEKFYEFDGVFVVPLFKLNSFLSNF